MANTSNQRVYLTYLVLMFTCVACKQSAQIDEPVRDSTQVVVSNTKPVVPAGPVVNTVLTEAYVKNVAAFAYLWAWPMVNIHNRKVKFEKVPQPGYMGGVVPIAPANQMAMLTDYILPEERVVACPNQDVVYGFGLMDFSKEPVVIQVPDFGNRFWVYQICDQRTDGFAEVGKMYGTMPGFYLLTGADWNGDIPKGIEKVFKCPTKLGVMIPRAFQKDEPADKKSLQPVLQQIMLYPLSEYDGKMKLKDWTAMPKYPADNSSGSQETKWVNPEMFFDVLPEILGEVPALPGEEALYAQLKMLLDAATKDARVKGWLKEAAFEADQKLIEPLFKFENVGYPAGHHWTTQSNGAQFGTDYLTRTACAKANIFVNKPNETKYFYQDLDSTGARLNGRHAYTVTFAKGETPPVKGFWSLTLYNQYHFFFANPILRYSLGTKTENLQYNADGSLTLYVQSTPPDKNKMSNWLPSPKEPFSLYIRSYWPEEAVLNGTWMPPPVVKGK